MPSASTTLDSFGNNLLDPVPQSGWQVEADGFGLLQAQVKFKWDISMRGDFPTKFAKGVKLETLIIGVEAVYANLGIWKASMITDKNNVLIVTADFCGIDKDINSGQFTNMQMAMTAASASEPIEHHPNFLVHNCISFQGTKVLAGFPPPTGWDASPTANPNRAYWTPKVAQGGAVQGQQFVGFLPNQNISEYPDHINIKAGIKSYYKPSITLRGLWYQANQTAALDLASYVGWTTDGTDMGMPEPYRKLGKKGGYTGNFQYTDAFEARISRDFLITNCSVEQFGNTWKITMDFMLSGIAGWDPEVYPPIVA